MMPNESVWPDSLAGQADRSVAQSLTDGGPASSSTAWSAPIVNEGAWWWRRLLQGCRIAGITKGAANGCRQTLHFNVIADDTGLFSAQPAVALLAT